MGADPYSQIRTLMLGSPGLQHGMTEWPKFSQPAAGASLTRKVPNNVWWRPRALAFTYTADANTPGRQPVVRYRTPDNVVLVESPIGSQVGPSGVVNCFAWPGAPSGSPAGLSIQGDASVTSPAAGGTIASITLTQGTWTIAWAVRTSGTVAAADNNNMQLNLPGAVTFVANVPQGGSNLSQQNAVIVEVPVGGATITVTAIAIGTVGAIYTAQIAATPGEATSGYGPLPDLLLRSGWTLEIAGLGIQVGDQISSIFLLVDEFPSGYASGADWREEQEEEAEARAGLGWPG